MSTPMGPNDRVEGATPGTSTTCGCCEGTSLQTPVEVSNRPGLTAIAYRVGTHARFKQSMLAGLSDSARPALRGLNTRDDDDFSIALLDAWAMVGDVLTFYQERIANESYLRTATERRSVAELARLIGYELNPGVAASAYLAFTLEDAVGAPGEATIPKGTKVKSIPGQDEKPQTYETLEEIEGRAEWNAITPRQTQPQTISTTMTTIVLEGVGLNIQPGDRILIIVQQSSGSGFDNKLRRVSSVTTDNDAKQTTVTLEAVSGSSAAAAEARPAEAHASIALATGQSTAESFERQRFDESNIENLFGNQVISQSQLRAKSYIAGWDTKQVLDNVGTRKRRRGRGSGGSRTGGTSFPIEPGVYIMRARASLFAYNAPDWNVMSEDVKTSYKNAAGDDWPDPPTSASNQISLDAVYSKVTPGSWAAVLREAEGSTTALEVVAQVSSVVERALAYNGVSGKSSELLLNLASGQDVSPATMSDIRQTTVFAQSEQLTLAELPITDPVAGDEIVLDQFYDGLEEGHVIIVTGERSDAEGITASETAELLDALQDIAEARTTLVLTNDLTHSYKRDTVSINANVALASHGETVSEVLGSGDASQSYQKFTLRQSPLTFVAADTPSGGASTLEVRVNDLLWEEVPTLYGHGPQERIYTTYVNDDATTTVQFGDGVTTGARLPTGQENVTAVYRKGVGEEGEVNAGQLTLLMTRPLGVRGVTNPLDASGAEDPQVSDDARTNAPLTVLTLERIVSLRDYEDFARSFSGIDKAQATWIWNIHARGVYVTVAGNDGDEVLEGTTLHTSLVSAMKKAGDEAVPVRVESFRPAYFKLAGAVRIDPAYLSENVMAEVDEVLRERFSFEARAFGQPVALSEVVAVIKGVEGVVSVDLNQLHRSDQSQSWNALLVAQVPTPGEHETTVQPAELLMLDPSPTGLEAIQ